MTNLVLGRSDTFRESDLLFELNETFWHHVASPIPTLLAGHYSL